jgi:ribonuclease HI
MKGGRGGGGSVDGVRTDRLNSISGSVSGGGITGNNCIIRDDGNGDCVMLGVRANRVGEFCSIGWEEKGGKRKGGRSNGGKRKEGDDEKKHNNTKTINWKLVISDEEGGSGEEEGGEGEWGDHRTVGVVEEDKEGIEKEAYNNLKNHQNKNSNTKKPKTHNLLTGIQYLINSEILFTREHLKAGGRIDNVAKLICKATIARIAHLAPTVLTNSSLPGNHFSEEDLKLFAKKVKSYGASGKRSREQATAAAAHAAELVNSLPNNSIQIWTDGAMLGDGERGPTGAGAMIAETGSYTPSHRLKYHLGEGTNQLGKIWAIGGALETVIGDINADNVGIHIFSDSEYAIKCITGAHTSKTHYNIVKHVIALLGLIPKNLVQFHQVAGHAGIPGNKAADELANAGAVHSERELKSHDLSYIAETFGFNHQLISSNCNCSGNCVCSTCNSNSSGSSAHAYMQRDGAPRNSGNSRRPNYNSSMDDLKEELVLPNVFRDSLSIFN